MFYILKNHKIKKRKTEQTKTTRNIHLFPFGLVVIVCQPLTYLHVVAEETVFFLKPTFNKNVETKLAIAVAYL